MPEELSCVDLGAVLTVECERGYQVRKRLLPPVGVRLLVVPKKRVRQKQFL